MECVSPPIQQEKINQYLVWVETVVKKARNMFIRFKIISSSTLLKNIKKHFFIFCSNSNNNGAFNVFVREFRHKCHYLMHWAEGDGTEVLGSPRGTNGPTFDEV